MQSYQVQPQHDNARQHLVEVLAEVALQNGPALSELYELTSAKLFGICVHVCRDRVAAEDILQEVYLKIWHRAGQYQPTGNSPISWLAVIARNTAIDWCRKNGNGLHGDQAVIDLIADDAPLADTGIERQQQQERILHCLEQLDEKQNAHIRSAFFGGNTYEVLAQKDDIALSTVKSRIRRGLQRLKKCLENG